MFIDDIHFFIDGRIPEKIENIKLFDTNEGFQKGNMFSNEYIPYKEFKTTELTADNEEDNLLLKISETEFAINDLGLYLDLHPNNIEVFSRYINEVKKYNKLQELYQREYKPLILTDENQKSYIYYKNPWPWDKDGGIKYV